MEINHSVTRSLRAILTESLPYEIPLELRTDWLFNWISERAQSGSPQHIRLKLLKPSDLLVYSIIRGNGSAKVGTSKIANNEYVTIKSSDLTTPWRAPGSFNVRRNRIKKRRLNHVCLTSQLAFGFFYAKNSDVILHYTGLDRSSLRHPKAVNSFGKVIGLERDDQSLFENIAIETMSKSVASYNSFFSYDRYAFIGQFYDSPRWQALEGRWTYLRRLDISNCFASIYTHSIAWSTSTDQYSKSHLGSENSDLNSKSFGQVFDLIMRSANWGETHGILVGPEASRIFAEIVFQKLQRLINSKISSLELSYSSYEILRYVDDYFIFANSEADLDSIEAAISDTISEFGFDLNDSKTQTYITPFTTDISLKMNSLKEFLRSALGSDPKAYQYKSREISIHLKSLLVGSNNDAAAVGSSLTHVERHLKEFISTEKLKCYNETEILWLIDHSWNYLHNVFFQYLSHPSIAACMKVVRMLRNFYLEFTISDSNSAFDYKGARVSVEERLNFVLSKAIDRLCDADSTEIELCHFLSLASSCTKISSLSPGVLRKLLRKIERGIDRFDSARGDTSFVYLLLSTMKYFGWLGNKNRDFNDQLFELALRTSKFLLDDAFIPIQKIGSHAAQEIFVLSIIDCPFLSSKQKLQLLNSTWVTGIISRTLEHSPTDKEVSIYLEDLIDFHSQPDSTFGFFEWSTHSFDALIYKKEPQFVY